MKGSILVKNPFAFVFAFTASILSAGCTGVLTISPENYAAAILSSGSKFAESLATKPDGTYRGSYTIVLPAGSFAAFRHFEVDVRVSSGQMASISLIEPEIMRTADFFLELPAWIIDRQTLDVDVISGVTFSSVAFKKAVEDAIEN